MSPLHLIDTAFAILLVAATAGIGLAIPFMREGEAKLAPRAIPPVHGAVGAAGLAVLFIALYRGLPPSTMGTAGFGVVAGILLALALALGLLVWVSGRRARRPAGALVATHASLAIAGLVVLWVLVSLG